MPKHYTIRGLVWELLDKDRLVAKSSFGEARILRWNDGLFILADFDGRASAPTLEAAKALAEQRHVERMERGLEVVSDAGN